MYALILKINENPPDVFDLESAPIVLQTIKCSVYNLSGLLFGRKYSYNSMSFIGRFI